MLCKHTVVLQSEAFERHRIALRLTFQDLILLEGSRKNGRGELARRMRHDRIVELRLPAIRLIEGALADSAKLCANKLVVWDWACFKILSHLTLRFM